MTARRVCLPKGAAQLVRMCPPLRRATAGIKVVLRDAVEQSPYRARGSARYRVAFGLSWLGLSNEYVLVDGRGVDVAWTWGDVASWLEKTLGGWPIAVEITFDGGRLSQRWGRGRADGMAAWLGSQVSSAWTDEADRLRARVDRMDVRDGRREVLGLRADSLDGLAQLHEQFDSWLTWARAGGVEYE